MGSISFITDENGDIVEQRSYEPFGEIRSMDYGSGLVPANTTDITTRSFTNHEQVEELNGLIHMDGRVYDSTIGRFVSADIHVPYPYSTQSYNRYSYVRNNPLGFTDPSGYEGKIVNKAGLIEHLIQQKIDTAPTSIQTSKDHTPKNGSVRSWATQQVRLENPDLFTEGGSDQTYLIDVEPNFWEHGTGEFIGSIIGDPYAAYFNNGYNPITNRVMSKREILDNKFLGLVGMVPSGKGASLAAPSLKNLEVVAKGLLERAIGSFASKKFDVVRNGYKIFNKNGTLTNEAIKNSLKIKDAKYLHNPKIPSGYSKYTTKHYEIPSGKADTHFYMNKEGKIHYDLDYKSKF